MRPKSIVFADFATEDKIFATNTPSVAGLTSAERLKLCVLNPTIKKFVSVVQIEKELRYEAVSFDTDWER
jgi:hypothetical protein